MMPEKSTSVEYQPGSPVVAERICLYTQDPHTVLTWLLTRFGLPPHQVGFRAALDGEVQVLGRDHAGREAVFARIFYGQTADALTQCRDELIRDDWKPRVPRFETFLPDGRTV